jgi:hypothetical protein
MFLEGIVNTRAESAKGKKNRPTGPCGEALVNPS